MSDTDAAQSSPPVILGVGASAGGLEAFQSLLATLRATDDFAMVLVQHLDPEHESLLPELLSKRTRLPVRPITDGMELKAGEVYLIPPAFELDIQGTTLKLVEFDTPRGLRRPIDRFFESLAREQGTNAAAIILSGTGSDGAQGVRAIKEEGGLVFAQDPQDAKYDGMPRAAIATGAVDMVLPSGDILGVMRDFHDRATGLAPTIESDAEFIEKVVRNLRYRTGHDFSGYKSGTLLRRITLRMSVLGLRTPSDYLRELIQDRGEAEKLFRDLLINVTSFFRDRESFAALREQVIPQMLADKGPGDELRVWVPGCSTGQEAYTIAMILADEMSRLDCHARLSVFGTDIDEDALTEARRGYYPNTIATEVPQNWLDRWFTATHAGYEVRPELRDIVRFSSQNLIKDPPFSRLDLVTCRNVLIYFDNPLQETALSVFHYALRPGGWLMLGSSESARQAGEPFRDISPEHRLYQRDNAPARPLDLPRGYRPPADTPPLSSRPSADSDHGLPPAALEALLEHHVPPYLVLSQNDEVSIIGPGSERFVKIPTGRATLGARALILPELKPALKRVLTGLALGAQPYRRITVSNLGGTLPETLALGATALSDGNRLVTFETDTHREGRVESESQIVIDEDYVGQLETELDNARQTIRTTVEELETSNEELKSSNEEMMSMNEELQSANEELSTTNEELQTKLRELAQVNSDLANFMESTQIATIFLDDELRLRNFTPEAVAWFRFVEQDRGREITDIGSRLDMEQLAETCRRVRDNGQPEELALSTSDGRAEVMVRIAPYRTETRHTGGIVFSVFDVTELASFASEAEAASAEARARMEEIEELYRVSPGAMGLVDREYRYLRANPRLAEINGVSTEDHIGQRMEDVVPDIAAAKMAAIDKVLETGEPVLGVILRGTTRADPEDERTWQIDFYPLQSGAETPGAIRAVGFNVQDITDLLALQADLRRIMRELQHRVKNMLSNVIALVNRARREKGDPARLLETLSQRIRALANTHNLLTAENWSSTALRDVLSLELTDVYGSERIETHGPAVRLNARATLAIGMAVHELATNAVKYGAFSVPEGHISLRWSRIDEGDGESFVLRWTETGGPPAVQPEHEGFGTTLVRSMIEGTLGGKISPDWNSEGLRLVITLPWLAATEVDYDSDVDPLRQADPLP
ncbi:PAS domain-containing protein [Pseudooceanicola sp. 216_PA32_1]|uniref:histidine kinase n=2 Tax=Pseudooceanicola pacificus TaxID=2676438 RepID=A0A844W3J5_9RHOB|nr:PAS domain-containing protein [Pseudooceanicola pacificus]